MKSIIGLLLAVSVSGVLIAGDAFADKDCCKSARDRSMTTLKSQKGSLAKADYKRRKDTIDQTYKRCMSNVKSRKTCNMY